MVTVHGSTCLLINQKHKSEAEDNDKLIKARQSYNFSTKEATQFFTYLLSVKTPSSYSANIRSLVDVSSGKMKLGHMKSHDCHVMLTQILPVAIRNLMDKDIRNTLIDLCDFFNQLWQKVVDPEELDHMQDDIARILSNLEMFSHRHSLMPWSISMCTLSMR